jgi:DNA topoisomerase IB
VSRKCYIHPGVFEAYAKRALIRPSATSQIRREKELARLLKRWSTAKPQPELKRALADSIKLMRKK